MSNTTSLPQWDPAWVFPLQRILVDAAATCLGYGCFLILAIITVCVLIRRGLSSTGQRNLLIAVLISLVSSTIYYGAYLAGDLANLALGPDNDNESAVKLLERTYIVIAIFSSIIYLLNDILVVWRAWVLTDQLILRIILACSMFITMGCTIAETSLFIQAGIFRVPSWRTKLLLDIPLVFNNLLATSVVLSKTWIYKTQIKTHLQQVSSRSQVERVLLLLVESGFIYCGWWILLIIATYVKSVPIMMYTVINALCPFAAAIYPILIILVVEHQKSQAEYASAKSIIHSIQFNSHPQQSDGQTGSTSVSIVQSIVDIQLAQKRSSHSASRQLTSQVQSTSAPSIIQAIVSLQSARNSKKEGRDAENKRLHDNDLAAVA